MVTLEELEKMVRELDENAATLKPKNPATPAGINAAMIQTNAKLMQSILVLAKAVISLEARVAKLESRAKGS